MKRTSLPLLRREFITLLAGAAAWPLAARGQQTPIVGYLHTQSSQATEAATSGFRKGLTEGGFVEGRNVTLEYRYANGQVGDLTALAADLARRPVSVIAAMGGSRSALAAKAVTSVIPIVFTMGDADPVTAGLVPSLARPNGNTTGVSLLGGLLGAKRLELLRELVPGATSIGVLINPENRNAAAELNELEAAIVAAGQRAVILRSGPSDNLEATISELVRERADALVVTADPIFTNRRQQLTALTARYRIPAIYQWSLYAEAGGLMSYGTDVADAHRQAGVYTARLLKGEKPADLPVLQPTKFELVINLKTAKALGLDVPPTLLALADEVIE
jgi:putative tryptophan/tyrosine transport system substrate-binding protein